MPTKQKCFYQWADGQAQRDSVPWLQVPQAAKSLLIGTWILLKNTKQMVLTLVGKPFVATNHAFFLIFHLIDWEYPGKQAAGCNEFADNDADNFLLLLKELRQALDNKFPKEHKEISMAVHVQPFIKSGVPMTDLKPFVPYFDHVNLMTYGKFGSKICNMAI